MRAAPRTEDTGMLPIGEVSRRTGLTVAAIRYYEQRGLVTPLRRSGGQRRFSPAAVRQLQVVTVVRQAGFTLAEVSNLISLRRSGRPVRDGLLACKLAEVQRDTGLRRVTRAAARQVMPRRGRVTASPVRPPLAGRPRTPPPGRSARRWSCECARPTGSLLAATSGTAAVGSVRPSADTDPGTPRHMVISAGSPLTA